MYVFTLKADSSDVFIFMKIPYFKVLIHINKRRILQIRYHDRFDDTRLKEKLTFEIRGISCIFQIPPPSQFD